MTDSEKSNEDVLTRQQLIEKLQEVALDRYLHYSTILQNSWYQSNTLSSYEEWLTDYETEKLARYEQEMLQFDKLQ